jgi:hypothetical protein
LWGGWESPGQEPARARRPCSPLGRYAAPLSGACRAFTQARRFVGSLAYPPPGSAYSWLLGLNLLELWALRWHGGQTGTGAGSA